MYGRSFKSKLPFDEGIGYGEVTNMYYINRQQYALAKPLNAEATFLYS